MRFLLPTLTLLLLSSRLFGQIYTGPIEKPTSGYGTDGTHLIGIEVFSNPYFPSMDIEIYHPSDILAPVPTLFYSHAYGGNLSFTVQGLLNWVARKGYAIVFVPYQTSWVTGWNAMKICWKGLEKLRVTSLKLLIQPELDLWGIHLAVALRLQRLMRVLQKMIGD